MSKLEDKLQLEWIGKVLVITPIADISIVEWSAMTESFDALVKPATRQARPRIILDLSARKSFDSTNLLVLFRCHELNKRRASQIVLCGASEMALNLLALTSLDKIWKMFNTREEALEAFAD